MSAPRIRAFLRPSNASPQQCLRQQAAQRAARMAPRVTLYDGIRQARHRSSQSTLQATKALWREYPLSVTGAFAAIIFGAGTLIYTNFVYNNYIIGAFHKYPEPVAKQLRKALYYTNISLSPHDALKYYKQALQVANEINMDPFSDEVLGIKIQVAFLFEKIQQCKKATEVLEAIKKDCLKWIEMFGSNPGMEGKRTRILAKTVGISVKLGELYSSDYVLENESAEENLVWAVTTALKEQRRREEEGVKPDEGDWLSSDEIGGSIEALGHHYEEKDQHYLAAPLFLQAVTLSSPSGCHTAVLMNNLSISLAQQIPPSTPGQAPTSRPALVSNAREWAQKAIDVAKKVQPPERTEECDTACAVATHNLGEFAEMDGNIAEARRRYQEARSLAQAVGFQEGVANSDAGLKRLGNT